MFLSVSVSESVPMMSAFLCGWLPMVLQLQGWKPHYEISRPLRKTAVPFCDFRYVVLCLILCCASSCAVPCYAVLCSSMLFPLQPL